MGIHSVQTVLLLLLAVVAGFTMLAERLKVPYAIVLLLAGLALSLLPHMPRVPLEPNVIFLLFLPPLLYRASWMTSWRDLKRNMVSVAMLAVGLVAFTVFGVAEFVDRFITALDWRSGFLLGAVISTTDAVAASAIAKRVGLPKGIVDILEGESLVNDATGLLALQFGVALVVEGRTPTVAGATGTFLWLILGGIAMGLLVGVVIVWIERHVEDGPVEMVLSILAAYASYLLGERVHASGVLAVVACGLYVSRKSKEFFSPQVRLQAESVWASLDFTLNGIVFCLIGLQMPYVLEGITEYSWRTLLEYGAVFSAVLIALRLVWVFPGALVAWLIRTRLLHQRMAKPEAKGVFVVGWTGMRGVIALAAAISLPERLANGQPFAHRDLIIFLTFCVILVTLVGQGLTLPALVRALGISDQAEDTAEETHARQAAIDAAVAFLEQRRASIESSTIENGTIEGSTIESSTIESKAEQHAIKDMLHQYEHRRQIAGNGSARDGTALQRLLSLAQGAAQAERRALLELWEAGTIGDETMRRVERELDLVESRIESRGDARR